MTPEKRIVLAVKLLDAVRENIRLNGGRYNGGAAPNLQSVFDVFSLSDDLLQAQFANIPLHYLPSPEEEDALRRAWAGLPERKGPRDV